MKRRFYFPITLSMYPVLSLLAANITQVELLDAMRSLVVSILLACIVYALFWIWLRDALRAAVLSTYTLILFFSYGHVYALIENLTLFSYNIGRHRFLLLVWVLLFVVGFIWVKRSPQFFIESSGIINIACIIMVSIPIFRIISFEIGLTHSAIDEENEGQYEFERVDISSDVSVSEIDTFPDIYYIILDMYTRGDILESKLDYDNSPFLNDLEKLGFYVASCSYSNYGNTVLSLGSSLNLDYFQNLVQDYSDTISPYKYGNLVKDNQLRNILKDLGYQIIAFESGFSPTEWDNADRYLAPQKNRVFGGLNTFESMFIRTTLGIFLFEIRDYLPVYIAEGLDGAYFQHRERILFTLDEIENVPSFPGPKFVFVHILAPHNPFAFGRNGEPVRRNFFFTLNKDRDSDTWDEFAPGYIDQVIFLNTRMSGIIRRILEVSDPQPIIIIQGDHGIPRMSEPDERLAILNAYYFAGLSNTGLYSNISPVNTFRLVLHNLLGTNYDLLDDKSYYTPQGHSPLDFEEIPAIENSCLSGRN
jgi:hypothetical protein